MCKKDKMSISELQNECRQIKWIQSHVKSADARNIQYDKKENTIMVSNITCCLKRSALSEFFANIRRPETNRSNRCTAAKINGSQGILMSDE